MKALQLHFDGSKEPELIKTRFAHPLIEPERKCVRGRFSGAYTGYGTFTWSRAVRALSVLLLNAKLSPNDKPHLVGAKGSLASSLDYAIDKEPVWMADMLGTLPTGGILLKRLINRTNSNLRRRGPVALSLNASVLTSSDIHIFLDDRAITEITTLHTLVNSLSNTTKIKEAA